MLCTNILAADDADAHQVSWQSAYWPIMACILAVLLQETGRVLDAPIDFSYSLRACPVACAFDTLMMLLKFVVMLAVGCSPRNAVRHVWYDRFDQDQEDRVQLGLMEYRNEYAFLVDGGPESLNLLATKILEVFREFVSVNDREHPSDSVAADNTIELVSSEDLDGCSCSVEDEHMCSGALPAVDHHQQMLTDVTLATSQPTDALSISQTLQTANIPSMDVAEVGISVSEGLERPGEETSVVLLNDASNNLPEQSRTIVNDAATVPEPLPRTNTFMMTANYMNPPPGSTIDRNWRLSMISFGFGALPQAIKIFAMRGIPCTQAFVGIFLISFIVPEVFRTLAGPVGQCDLYSLPIVLDAKSHLTLLSFSLWVLTAFYMVLLSFFASFQCVGLGRLLNIVLAGSMLAFPVTLLLFGTSNFLTRFISFARCFNGMRSCFSDLKFVQFVRTNLVTFIAGSFALSSSTVEPCLPFVFLYLTCLVGTVWGISLVPVERSAILGFVAWLSLPFALLCLYLTYRFLFVGCFSAITRCLCGAQGTKEEFLKGTMILVNIATITMGYAFLQGYASYDTFKPPWTDVLG